MTLMQERHFRKLLSQFEHAVFDHAHLGAQPPEDREAIKARYKIAKQNLIDYATKAK